METLTLADAIEQARAEFPGWLTRLKESQQRRLDRRNGAIPPYGTFFRREDAHWEERYRENIFYYSRTKYVLKVNDRYWVWANGNSEVWWLFCDGHPFASRSRMTDAMLLMLTVVGIAPD